jgi:hypothetical protein
MARSVRQLAVALLVLGVSIAPSLAAASGGENARPTPPTGAEVQRATDALLDSLAPPGTRDSGSGTGGVAQSLPPATPGTAVLFPDNRLVALYGAPQMGATVLGRKSVEGAQIKLRKQAGAYEGENRRPVIGAFDLVAVIATADAGSDGMYRFRQPDTVIAAYLSAARAEGARLVLDIQPGRSRPLAEVRALGKWVRQPDVDVALDPEWDVGRRGKPGVDEGSVKARAVNRISSHLAELVRERDLPQKALIVHQFRDGSVRHRRELEQRDEVAVTLNFDGIGSEAAKAAGYAGLGREEIFNGFSLFYRLDSVLMRPTQVLRLRPRPDYVMYQ